MSLTTEILEAMGYGGRGNAKLLDNDARAFLRGYTNVEDGVESRLEEAKEHIEEMLEDRIEGFYDQIADNVYASYGKREAEKMLNEGYDIGIIAEVVVDWDTIEDELEDEDKEYFENEDERRAEERFLETYDEEFGV